MATLKMLDTKRSYEIIMIRAPLLFIQSLGLACCSNPWRFVADYKPSPVRGLKTIHQSNKNEATDYSYSKLYTKGINMLQQRIFTPNHLEQPNINGYSRICTRRNQVILIIGGERKKCYYKERNEDTAEKAGLQDPSDDIILKKGLQESPLFKSYWVDKNDKTRPSQRHPIPCILHK